MSYPFGSPGAPNQGLPAFHVKRSDSGFIPAPTDLAELQQRSLNVMLPHVKEELSLFNSIYELKDFKRLPGTLKNMYKTVKGTFGSARKTIREYFRSTADGYLTDQFAIRPLLSDIAGIFSALSNVEKRMNVLITQSAKTQRKHFAFRYSEFGPLTVEETHDDPGYPVLQNGGHGFFGQWAPHRRVEYSPSYFHAMIE